WYPAGSAGPGTRQSRVAPPNRERIAGIDVGILRRRIHRFKRQHFRRVLGDPFPFRGRDPFLSDRGRGTNGVTGPLASHLLPSYDDAMWTGGVMRVLLAGLTVGVCLGVSLGAADTTIKFTDNHLKNGLRVIVSEDHTAPTVSIAVTYNVGSADEKTRRTG